MKIGITGVTRGFGKHLISEWSDKYTLTGVSLRKGVVEVINQVKECDVFINHAHNSIDQSTLFKELFKIWKNKNKTIINFGTSAVYELNGIYPSYNSDKKHLYNLSKELVVNTPNKNVRVINFNPSTLESNSEFDNFNKLKFSELAKILEFIINLPQHLELSEICIKNTSREKKTLS